MSARRSPGPLLTCVAALAVATVWSVSHAHAQTARDSSVLSPSIPLTKQEIADACNHKPGARLRLYGCSPEASGIVRPPPVYIIDGVVRIVDSTATQSPSQLKAWLGLHPDSILDITVVHPDSAAARYGSRARGGAILIRTKPDRMQAKPAERALLPPKIR